MPIVRFTWSPDLVSVRREACPQAHWMAAERAWRMSAEEVDAFLAASHKRLDYARLSAEVMVDQECWVIGFIQGAPLRR
jgi:hypothetical protein